MRIFFFVCFSYCRMCSLLAYHIIYTWLRLFIAVYVYFRIAYIICEPHWIDRQHDHEQLQVWAYAIFGWLFDFDHSFHHLALKVCVRFTLLRSFQCFFFFSSLVHFIYGVFLVVFFVRILFYDDYSLVIFWLLCVVLYFLLLFRLNCMYLKMWMHFYISNWNEWKKNEPKKHINATHWRRKFRESLKWERGGGLKTQMHTANAIAMYKIAQANNSAIVPLLLFLSIVIRSAPIQIYIYFFCFLPDTFEKSLALRNVLLNTWFDSIGANLSVINSKISRIIFFCN